METVHHRRTVGCGLTDAMYDEVRKAALKRGITVSELVRHYIEEGLSNPTPAEIRRLNDRLSTMEGAIKELYQIAVMNWGSVESEPKKSAKFAMPWEPEFDEELKKEGTKTAVKWMPGFLDKWKNKLSGMGLVNEKTGKTAYEELEGGVPDLDDESWPAYMTEEETEDLLRDMWKAEGCWTQEEEKEYQERRKAKREPKYRRVKKLSGAQKPKPKSSD